MSDTTTALLLDAPARVAIRVLDLDDGETREIHFGSPLHEATCEWARFHGIDPLTVPAGSLLVRDASRCRVLYETLLYDPPSAAPEPTAIVVDWDCGEDDDGFTGLPTVARWSQGETPPLPFPN